MMKKKMLRIVFIAMMIIISNLIFVNVANAAVESSTGDTTLSGILYKDTNLRLPVTVNVSQLSVGDTYWVKNATETLKSRAIFCAERGETFSGKQQYKVTGVYNITESSSSYLKGLGYIISNSRSDFDSLKGHVSDPTQIAFWHFLQEHRESSAELQAISPGYEKTVDGNDLYNEANAFKDYKYQTPKITIERSGWDSDYKNLEIEYNIKDFKVQGDFAGISNITLSYYDSSNTLKTMSKTEPSGTFIVSNASDTNRNYTITVNYWNTKLSAKLAVFQHVNDRQQRLAIVSGSRWKENKTVSTSGTYPPRITNISLQKYITKVTNIYGEVTYSSDTDRKNKYADTNENLGITAYNHAGKNVSTNNYSSGASNYKYENAVPIKVGDTVEYTITVYNNSDIPTNVTVLDEINSIGKMQSNYTVDANGRYILANNVYMAGKTEKTYKVNILYDTHTKNKIIDNKAWISTTTAKNITTYRTYDEDYVKMEQFEVSLEKYVLNVIHSNSDLDPENIQILNKYSTLINYLRSSKTSIDTLLNKYNEIKGKSNLYNSLIGKSTDIASKFINFDLNNDEKISNEDVNIYNAIRAYNELNQSNINSQNLEKLLTEYEKLDLDKDGIVDSHDLDVFKILKSDINNNNEIDENDLFAYLLKLNDYGIVTNRYYLRTIRLQQFLNNISINNIRTKMQGYINSDVTNDGIVNEYDIVNIKPNYSNVTNKQELIDLMKQYDINLDLDAENQEVILKVDYEDIALLEAYKNGNYDVIIEKEDDTDLTLLLEEMKSEISVEITEDIAKKLKDTKENVEYYDTDKDGYLEYEDIESLYQAYGELIDELELFKKENSGNDVTGDGNLTISDIELLQNYLSISATKETLDSLSVSDIQEFISNNDILIDYSVDYTDICFLTTTEAIPFDMSELEKYDVCDDDNVVDSKDVERVIYVYSCFIDFGRDIDELISDIEYYIWLAQYNDAFDINEDGNVDETDKLIAEQYKYYKESNIIETSIPNFVSQNDINNDGYVDVMDEIISNTIASDKVFNEEYLDTLEYYDITGDGKVDQNDLDALDTITDASIATYIEVMDELGADIEKCLNYLETLETDEQFDVNNIEASKLKEYVNYLISYPELTEIVSNILKNKEGYSIDDIDEEDFKNHEIYNGFIEYIKLVDKNDRKYVFSKGVSKINVEELNLYISLDMNQDGFNSEDATLLKNFDLNNSNTYDQNDLSLYNELSSIAENQKEHQKVKDLVNAGTSQESYEKDRKGKAEYLTKNIDGKYADNTKNDKEWTRHNTYKYDEVVNVSNGDTVIYKITVTNDGNSYVYITEISDYLCYISEDGKEEILGDRLIFTDLENKLLAPGESASFTMSGTVTESNMSVKVIKNTAQITKIKNTNGIVMDADKTDSTPYNNKDSDYIQTRDIIISGTVWNDKAFDKEQNYYNGLYDDNDEIGHEEKLPEIKVLLYRGDNLVSSRYTDKNGNYQFSVLEEYIDDNGIYHINSDIGKAYNKDGTVVGTYAVAENAKNIKGEKKLGTKRWIGTYYSYYVVFEYDGITYTSTKFADVTSNNSKDSNARENLDSTGFDGRVKDSRAKFNRDFETINNGSAIKYDTNNEDGYIPQSIHQYSSNMNMQSSTTLISLSNDSALEQQLRHINLGLRGRDIFDLELTSDVDNIKVTVNEQTGVYRYNKVTLRKSDLTPDSTTTEDMANKVLEKSNNYVEEYNQDIRTSDLDITNTGTNGTAYDETQGISNIEITYKITVHNTSRTSGTATKVTNYYDTKYNKIDIDEEKGKVAYYYATEDDKQNDNKIWISKENIKVGDSGNGFESIVITTPATMLKQSETMDIYVVYTVTEDFMNELKGLQAENSRTTFNMSEITEYKTGLGEGQTDYTRGLIDKDSAPGSANREQVRTTENEGQENLSTTDGNPTTVEYYFNKKLPANTNNKDYLMKLKYEDDTYASPTLYFVSNEVKRMISGTVFEDYTQLIGDGDIKVKTGDGVQDTEYNFEPGIEGATVELLEIVEGQEEPVLRYTTTTGDNGEYAFSGFLPGNYIIKYHYGDTDKTFLLDNSPNTKSYNGEDFQSTNNTGSHNSNELKYNELEDDQKVLWYAYNKSEGISTATDITQRREDVSTSVTNFSDDQMTVLNNARDGMSKDAAKVNDITVDSIIEATKMYAQTNPMLLTVEETVLGTTSDNKVITIENDSFPDEDEVSYPTYNVSNMNFGIAEVPVTTIDLQKHVYSFTIKDSTGTNTLAAIQKDLNNTAVTVNPSKIAPNRIETVIKVLDDVLVEKDGNYTADYIRNKISYNPDITKNINENISVKTGLTQDEINKLETAITKYSLAKEIKIVQAWKVTDGNVLAAPGASVIDVSIEDDKLQGAKLEVTYEMSANIHAEKNFNSEPLTIPSIKGIVDYIDNNLSYNEISKVTNESSNNTFWSLAKQSEITFGEGEYGERFGTLDPEGTQYSTILTAKDGNALLREECGKGTAYITLEKVLSSTDMTIQDIITSNVDMYEYKNSIEITALEYKNQEGEEGFIYRDRVRTADRYIILAGRQHDSATSETITIHPPTGDSSINTIYYVIAAISLAVLAAGIFGIKKFVLKK